MSFKDLEKKTQKVEDKTDVKPEVGNKKVVPDLPDPTKTARGVYSKGNNEDLFDNVPI